MAELTPRQRIVSDVIGRCIAKHYDRVLGRMPSAESNLDLFMPFWTRAAQKAADAVLDEETASTRH